MMAHARRVGNHPRRAKRPAAIRTSPAAPDGITGVEWFGLVAVIGGTGAVWGLANDAPDDGGFSDLEWVLGILFVLVVLLVCGYHLERS